MSYIAIDSKRKKIFLKVSQYTYTIITAKKPHSVLMNQTHDKFESKYFNNNNKKPNIEIEH